MGEMREEKSWTLAGKAVWLIIVVGVYCGSCSVINEKLGLDDDNALEETVELIIESRTGLDVDLTPGSEE